MSKDFQAYQGDVLIERVRSVPKSAKKAGASKFGGRKVFVLAEGELTGHAHTIEETPSTEMYERDGTLYLKVKEQTEVKHQEHAAITLSPGTYVVKRQREYQGAEIRRVMD